MTNSAKNVFSMWQTKLLTLSLSTSLLLQAGCGGGAPAPVEKGGTEPPPTQTVTTKEMGPVESFQAMQKRIAEGDLVAVWDQLPASYQTEVTSVVQEFAGKMDPEVWSQIFGVVGKLQTVATNKKDILTGMLKDSNPQFAKPEDASFAHEQGLEVIKTLNNDQLSKLDSLKKFNGPEFIKKTLNPLYTATMKIYERFDIPGKEKVSPSQFMKDLKIELVKEEGDKATVKVQQGTEEPKEQTLVKVEGKWIPEDLQKNFSESIKSAKESIAAITPETFAGVKQQMATVVPMINSTLDNMEKAETAEQFKGAAMGMMGPAMMMMNGGNMFAPPPKSGSEPVPEKPEETKPEIEKK